MMGKDKKFGFKKAMGGYNKKDVNTYLASISAEALRRDEQYETEKGKLARALTDAIGEKEQAQALRDELACSLYAAEEENKRLSAELLEAHRIQDEMKASIGGFAERIHILETELAKKERENENTLSHDLNDKVEKIMATAGNSAHEIITNALIRSDEMIAEAQREAEAIRQEAMTESDELTDKAKDAYETASVYYAGVTRFATSLRDSLNKLMMEINEKRVDVGTKIEKMQTSSAEASKGNAEEGIGEAGRSLATLDEKIESFFKDTISAIRKMAGKD